MTIEDAVNVYTDGSSFQRPRRGGYGIRLVVIGADGYDDPLDIPLPGFPGATNNQMELLACVEGIRQAREHPSCPELKRIAIHTDSRYVRDNYDRARYYWSQNRWRTAAGRPVLNAELWKDLLREVKNTSKRVDFHWLKGHAGDPHNRVADKLAKKSAREPGNKPLTNVKVRRKLTEKTVQIGSVPPMGQSVTIRIINDEYLRLPKSYKYMFEVMSKRSPQYGNVDLVFSEELMNAGHCYYVQFNQDPRNPTVVKVYGEIPCNKPRRIDGQSNIGLS